MDFLFNLIRKYSKEKIYIFNYYNLGDEITSYINSRLDKIVDRYNISVIDTSDDNYIDVEVNILKKFY